MTRTEATGEEKFPRGHVLMIWRTIGAVRYVVPARRRSNRWREKVRSPKEAEVRYMSINPKNCVGFNNVVFIQPIKKGEIYE